MLLITLGLRGILTIIDKKRPPPCNHLDTGALRLLPYHLPDSYKVVDRNAPMSRWLQGEGVCLR